MRYYVVSDVHSYYSFLISALTEQGFFEDKEPHKLIICGGLLFQYNVLTYLQISFFFSCFYVLFLNLYRKEVMNLR